MNEIPWWAGLFCPRCGREFSDADPRRSEWQEVERVDGRVELVCPHCLTDEDLEAIANSLGISD